MLLTGVAAGFVWLWLAQPAEWEVRGTGIVLTEAAARGQFSVIVVFVVIGAVASAVWGWTAGRMLPELGGLLAVHVVVLTLVGSVIAWRTGVWLGPPDPRSVSGLSAGDRVPSELAVDGITPFLTWPILGLVGLIGAAWSGSRR